MRQWRGMLKWRRTDQIAEADTEVLTTAQGGPVADDQNTLKIGGGPACVVGILSCEAFPFGHGL